MDTHSTNGMTFDSRVQKNNQAKESKGYLHTFSKKEYENNSKGAVLMIVKISEDYYSLDKYKISLTTITLIFGGRTFFDN
jgi:hypothetical protein